jgi:hypothetical protein
MARRLVRRASCLAHGVRLSRLPGWKPRPRGPPPRASLDFSGLAGISPCARSFGPGCFKAPRLAGEARAPIAGHCAAGVERNAPRARLAASPRQGFLPCAHGPGAMHGAGCPRREVHLPGDPGAESRSLSAPRALPPRESRRAARAGHDRSGTVPPATFEVPPAGFAVALPSRANPVTASAAPRPRPRRPDLDSSPPGGVVRGPARRGPLFLPANGAFSYTDAANCLMARPRPWPEPLHRRPLRRRH